MLTKELLRTYDFEEEMLAINAKYEDDQGIDEKRALIARYKRFVSNLKDSMNRGWDNYKKQYERETARLEYLRYL